MNNGIMNNIKILCIGDKELCNEIKSLQSNNFIYILEILQPDINKIKYRLQHNSYDILVIDYNFLKQSITQFEMFTFSKMAFAMARPSLILCNNIFQKLYLKFLLVHTSWLLKFQSAKSLVHILTKSNLKQNTDIFNNSLSYHQYITKITNEIYNVFINQ